MCLWLPIQGPPEIFPFSLATLLGQKMSVVENENIRDTVMGVGFEATCLQLLGLAWDDISGEVIKPKTSII